MKLVVRVGKKLGRFLVRLLLLLAAAWAFGALHFDFPVFRDVIAGFFVVGVVMALFLPRGFWKQTAWAFALCGVVLSWWLTLTPRADRNWQPDVAELP